MARRCGDRHRAPHLSAVTAGRGGGRTHLVAAYDQISGITLGQTTCASEAGKGGKVAAAKTLTATLDERGLLTDAVIDAGFTARELAADAPAARAGSCASRATRGSCTPASRRCLGPTCPT